MLEQLRISRAGYPSRLPYANVMRRYSRESKEHKERGNERDKDNKRRSSTRESRMRQKNVGFFLF